MFIPKIAIFPLLFSMKMELITLKCYRIVWDKFVSHLISMMQVKTPASALASGGDGLFIVGTPAPGE